MVVEIGVSSIVLRLLTANRGVLSEGFVIFTQLNPSNPQQTSSGSQFIIKHLILSDFCYNFKKILFIPPTIPLPHNAT